MHDAKKYTWHKIAESIDELGLQNNGIASIRIAGKPICIVKHNELLSACFSKCPHAGGNLSEGYLDATGNIVCPIHRYKFNLQNGRNTSGEGYFLKVFPLEQRPDGLYVGFEENKLNVWLK